MMDERTPFPLAPPSPVDPAAIERGLEEFWKGAEKTPALGEAGGIVRARTLNLAVVLTADEQPGQVSNTIAPVTMRHPCRVFLLAARPELHPDALQTSVTALCHLPAPGQPHICCEQITVEAQGRSVDGLPHLLLALLVPDLPFVVWWRGWPPVDAPWFAALNAIADRVVVDTLALGANVEDLARIAPLVGGEPPLALADLAWIRLTPWRALTAQCFDTPDRQACLNELDRIRVEVTGNAVTSAALLWLGWLASRLRWTPRSAERDGSRYRYIFEAGRTVHAEISCSGEEEPGALCGIELTAGGASAFHCLVARCADQAVRASLHAPDAAPLERIVPLAYRDAATLLSDELDLAGRDRIYDEALRIASQLGQLSRRK